MQDMSEAAGTAVEAVAQDDAEVDDEEDDSNFLTPFVDFNAGIIAGVDDVLEEKLNIPNSFGFAIIGYTILVKAATFPLNQASLRTNAMMQLLSPKMKLLQERYKNDQETLNRMMLRLYDDTGVNPLGGCVPGIIQFPIFIGLYNAITKLAKVNERFREPFLWIPSLAGPVSPGEPSLDWLVKSKLEDGFEPLIGWTDAGQYCILPLMLVINQFITQRISSPQTGQQQGWLSNVLGLFPLIIGYTSLVSPSGLGVYWFTNNLLTVAQTQYIRNGLGEEFPEYKKMIDGTAAKEADEKKKRQEEEELAEAASGPGIGFAAGAKEDDDRKGEDVATGKKEMVTADAADTTWTPTTRKVKRKRSKRRR